ncbi:MAG: phosphoribosylglycinamide formyltransferase [Maricaulaceae bacterium]
MARRVPFAVLISGRGSNMAALLDAVRDPDFPAAPVLVLANRADAAGLGRAAQAGVRTRVISHKAYPDRQSFEADLHAALVDAGAELVCCAGFMRVLTEGFVDRWAGRLINIHPSLLPKYRGLHTHQRAIDAGDAEHGCTVHYVTAGVDEGPIIGQAKLTVHAEDTADTLADRVLALEHRLYPECLAKVARGLSV